MVLKRILLQRIFESGTVSELTVIAPFSKGGVDRLRAVLNLANGNFDGAEKVDSVHDMRFVFLDNDTKMLFATAYDGEWDAYIEDFATMIPDYMDILFTGDPSVLRRMTSGRFTSRGRPPSYSAVRALRRLRGAASGGCGCGHKRNKWRGQQ
jgi:hypothetical protein